LLYIIHINIKMKGLFTVKAPFAVIPAFTGMTEFQLSLADSVVYRHICSTTLERYQNFRVENIFWGLRKEK